jgi:hypothetical protein
LLIMTIRNWTPAAKAQRDADNIKLRQRVKATGSGPKKCWVPDCRKPSGASTVGMVGRFCKQHLSQHLRHGSPLRVSYAASETNPYRRVALAFLEANPEDTFVKQALINVTDRYRSAGPEIEPRNMRGTTPDMKANALWARLRTNGVPATYVLAAIAGVHLAFEADPQRPSGKWGTEFRSVQIAKVLLRMAGGEVKRWARLEQVVDPITQRTERPPPQELRVFPYSTGRVLRIIGEEVEKIGEVLFWHLEAMQELAASTPVTKALRKTPWPDRRPAKAKGRIPEAMKPSGRYATIEAGKQAKRKAAEKARKALKATATITPEQEAARQPSVRTLRDGVWVVETPGRKQQQ